MRKTKLSVNITFELSSNVRGCSKEENYNVPVGIDTQRINHIQRVGRLSFTEQKCTHIQLENKYINFFADRYRKLLSRILAYFKIYLINK
jgi:hypothetical protein